MSFKLSIFKYEPRAPHLIFSILRYAFIFPHLMPEWKRKIIQYLKEHESVSTSELAEALNLEPNTAKQHLFRLEKSGTLVKESRGRYKLPD